MTCPIYKCAFLSLHSGFPIVTVALGRRLNAAIFGSTCLWEKRKRVQEHQAESWKDIDTPGDESGWLEKLGGGKEGLVWFLRGSAFCWIVIRKVKRKKYTMEHSTCTKDTEEICIISTLEQGQVLIYSAD